MANLRDEFATDTESAEDGKWFTLRAAKKDAKQLRVKIRSATSKVYRREDQKLQRKYRGKFAAGNGYLDVDDQDEYDITLAVKGILVAWEGVEDDAKQEIPHSHANATKVLTEFPQFRRELFIWSKLDDNFKPAEVVKAEQDAIVKN